MREIEEWTVRTKNKFYIIKKYILLFDNVFSFIYNKKIYKNVNNKHIKHSKKLR